MPKLVTWMNNQRVGELTKLANGAHTFKYAPEWLASRYARPLSLSLPLQRGNITSDAVLAVREYTSAISNWQWGLTHPKAKKRQSIKFIRDIFWRQQRC